MKSCCGIEGNSFTVDETRTLKEKGLGMIPFGKTLLESFEILDHFRAYEYLLSNLDKPLTEELLKETHKLLTEHTLSFRTSLDSIPAVPGEYTKSDMAAGETMFGDHTVLIKQVPKLLESTNKAIEEKNIHPMVLAAKFHGYYEYLHPFRDGNGRLGRLLSNFILLKNEQPLIIIEREHRDEYITALKLIRKERTDEYLVDFFFKQSIKRMRLEIENKQNLTENYLQGLDFYGDAQKEAEFKKAIRENDFMKLTDLKEKGFIPSPEIMQSLKSSISEQSIISIEKIFNIAPQSISLDNIKLAQSNIDDKNIEMNNTI